MRSHKIVIYFRSTRDPFPSNERSQVNLQRPNEIH